MIPERLTLLATAESAQFIRADLALTPEEAGVLLSGASLQVAPEGMSWHDYCLLWHQAQGKLCRIWTMDQRDDR